MAIINILAELERCGQSVQYASGTDVKILCPFHDETNPSCIVSTVKEAFKCHSGNCGMSGDWLTLLAGILKTTRMVVYTDLAKRYDLETVKVIEPSVIERYHEAIWQAGPLLHELAERGVYEADIRKYRLGENKGRITIPVKNVGGLYVNIRRYLPGAPSAEKMRNSRGRGEIRLYPINQLEYKTIVVCGGEIKAIVAARELNPHGIGALTATAGEDNWAIHLTEQIISASPERLYIMMDIDAAGQEAAQRLAMNLYRHVPWLGIVQLPLDIDQFPKGDVNDYVGKLHRTDLIDVVQATPQWVSPTQSELHNPPDTPPVDVTFSDALKATSVAQRMKFRATVSAVAESSFIIPKTIRAVCRRDQGEMCSGCGVFGTDDGYFELTAESPTLLKMINVSDAQLEMAIRATAGVPKRCQAVHFDVQSHYDAEDIRVNASLEISNRDTDRTMQPAVCVGCSAELNVTYDLIGRMYPHPTTQVATLLISKSTATQDALSQYVPTGLERLQRFQPSEWTYLGIQAKLDEIYADLEANVTRIYLRRDLHFIFDLGYHSPLLLQFDGKIEKGWTEVLVVGDSAQGKSETALGLMRHYQLGERIDCKNVSVAGLLGGLRQMGNAWYVSWGIIPTHDKRLVILEELKGTSVETIGRLTDTRSSGIAELPKIEKRKTHARTRLVCVSNCREARTIASYAFGIESVRDLIGAPEDIRRFDAAMILANNEVNPADLDKLKRDPPKVPHEFTGEICRDLILWAWTRTPSQVHFDKPAYQMLIDAAGKLAQKFDGDLIPLVDRGSMHLKLARLSAALAARTFSTVDDTATAIRVRTCHVEYVAATLDKWYTARVCGYDAYSKVRQVRDVLKDTATIKRYFEALPFTQDTVDSFMHTNEIDLVDIQDWCGWGRTESQEFISLLVRKRALIRKGRAYVKSSAFTEWLRTTNFEDRPEHLNDLEEKF